MEDEWIILEMWKIIGKRTVRRESPASCHHSCRNLCHLARLLLCFGPKTTNPTIRQSDNSTNQLPNNSIELNWICFLIVIVFVIVFININQCVIVVLPVRFERHPLLNYLLVFLDFCLLFAIIYDYLSSCCESFLSFSRFTRGFFGVSRRLAGWLPLLN